MAGTRTTPPPMPSRPTSTPTPSPSRRMMNVMVTGLICVYRPDDSNQAILSSYLRHSSATPQEQAASLKMRAFFCLRGTCYIYLSLPRRSCDLRAAVLLRATWHPRKGESLDPDRIEVRHKVECDGTHAIGPKTRVFQRRPTEGRNHWLRLRRPAAGAALRRSGTQSHGI